MAPKFFLNPFSHPPLFQCLILMIIIALALRHTFSGSGASQGFYYLNYYIVILIIKMLHDIFCQKEKFIYIIVSLSLWVLMIWI